jgi:hypothetical protein
MVFSTLLTGTSQADEIVEERPVIQERPVVREEPVIEQRGPGPIVDGRGPVLVDPYYRDPRASERYVVASVIFKGGAGDYTGSIGKYTAVGPSYGVALNVEPLRWLGFELGYDGSYNQLDRERFTDYAKASFLRNGTSALLKFQIPFEGIRPFAGVGFGLSWVNISGNNHGGDFSNDLIGQLPLVVGLEIIGYRWTAGIRATYWVGLDQSWIKSGGSSALGGLLDVQSTIGIRF